MPLCLNNRDGLHGSSDQVGGVAVHAADQGPGGVRAAGVVAPSRLHTGADAVVPPTPKHTASQHPDWAR